MKISKRSPKDVSVYVPPGHADTFNRRLAGPDTGSNSVEVILGEMGSAGAADSHVHDDCDQMIYVLEGRLEVNDGQEVVEPGELIFFPKGEAHKVVSLAEKSKFLVIYSPPKMRGEK